jgi:hypothetical protein
MQHIEDQKKQQTEIEALYEENKNLKMKLIF